LVLDVLGEHVFFYYNPFLCPKKRNQYRLVVRRSKLFFLSTKEST
jgi:hypothetical protein